MFRKFIIFVLMLIFANSAVSINCAFFFNESTSDTIDNVQNSNRLKRTFSELTVTTPQPLGEFDCDDGFSPILFVASRFGPFDDNDPYEEIKTSCASTPQKIRPAYLQNTRNVVTKVLQSSDIIQEITIDKCNFANKNASWEQCNFDNQPVTQSNEKYVCRNIYYRISLLIEKAGKIASEHFYYPTNCVCELVSFE